MLRHIISNIKLSASYEINREMKRFSVANSIQEMLDKVDFDSESIPTRDFNQLQKLFTTLKGEDLSISEIELIEEISIKTKMDAKLVG